MADGETRRQELLVEVAQRRAELMQGLQNVLVFPANFLIDNHEALARQQAYEQVMQQQYAALQQPLSQALQQQAFAQMQQQPLWQAGLQQAGLQQAILQQAGLGQQLPPGPLGQSWDENDPAAKKAHALLLRLLSPEQQREYKLKYTFRETRGDRVYVLSYMTMGVLVYSREAPDIPIEGWCVFCPECPREDTLIAQLLLIRDDPLKLKAKAHVTTYGDGVPAGAAPGPGYRGGLQQFVQQVWDDGNRVRRAAAERILRRAGY